MVQLTYEYTDTAG